MSYIRVDCDHCGRGHDIWVDEIYDDFFYEVDKKRLVKDLVKDGWLDESDVMEPTRNYKDTDFNNVLIKLSEVRVQLTKEEEDLILKIANKF